MPNDIIVPVKALELMAEDKSAVAPEVGDEVEVSVKGSVASIDGDNVVIKPSSYNDIPYENDMSKEMSLDDERASLMGEAEKEDRMNAKTVY